MHQPETQPSEIERKEDHSSIHPKELCITCNKPCAKKNMKKLRKGMFCISCLKDERNYKRRLWRKNQRDQLLADPSSGFRCNLCDKVFLQPCQLRRHNEKVHIGEKPFSCEICGKSFARKFDMQNHKSYKHSDSAIAFLCTVCSRTYKCKHALKKHMSKTHSGDVQIFECDECGKALKSRSSLVQHKKRHSGEKTFQCDSCDETFFTRGAVKRHGVQHHDLAKPFLCDTCGASFFEKNKFEEHKLFHIGVYFTCEACGAKLRSESALKFHHLSFHTPSSESYSCDKCGKAFGHLLLLNKHKRTHLRTYNKVRKFSCHLCDLKFYDNGDLKNHLISHSKMKSLKCGVCDKMFSYTSSLRRHFKTLHVNTDVV